MLGEIAPRVGPEGGNLGIGSAEHITPRLLMAIRISPNGTTGMTFRTMDDDLNPEYNFWK